MKTRASLTLLAALVLAVATHAQQVRDQAPVARPGTAVISGIIVTDEQTPQPVRNAVITVINLDGGNRTTYTNQAGRFSVPGLAAGRYTLAANKAPFLRASYGSKRVDLPGTTITLKDGQQMTDVTLRMSRGAVITGRITDENGEPAFGVPVRVQQLRMQGGERSFLPPVSGTSSDTTDDRGMFRMYGLPPGEYSISATPRIIAGEVRAMTENEIRATMAALQQQQAARANAAQATVGGQTGIPAPSPTPTPTPDVEKVTVTYAPVYYPGTTTASTASTVTVGAGEERAGVEFSLRLVRTAKVEGQVIVPEGVAPQSVQLTMMPAAVPGAGLNNFAALETMMTQRVTPGPDGKFTYNAVAPGQYTISARATKPAGGATPPPPPPPPPPPGAIGMSYTTTARVVTNGGEFFETLPMAMGGGDPNATQYWAQADVSVDGAPVSGVALALQPGMTITGRVEFRSVLTRPGADFRTVLLNVAAVTTASTPRLTMGAPSSRVDEKGQFTIAGVTPGRYRINGSAPGGTGPAAGPPWRLASAIVKGRDILDFPLDVAPGDAITDAVLTFTDGTQEILGSLQDVSGRPAPDYTIVVFADDKGYWTPQSRRIRTARPATDGKFTVTGLPPGEYRMAAVSELAPGEQNDPAFLEQLVGASVKITLASGEKKTQDLKIAGGL